MFVFKSFDSDKKNKKTNFFLHPARQKKLVAIANQLLLNPAVEFFDRQQLLKFTGTFFCFGNCSIDIGA